ncbi:glycosyltransferase family protein [Cyclobacterium lianum]|nr:glycosyltransferase family 4 protein [Cyclobacterium lianum]
MFDALMWHADYILTHANAGREFVRTVYPEHISKVHVVPHPVSGLLGFGNDQTREKSYDLLIWGSVFRYKGIDKFLKFCNSSPEMKNVRILILGRCKDQDYKRDIMSILPDSAEFKDELLSLEDIAAYTMQSRFTLFTYDSKTVISSGSLIDAIRMGAVVIGPDHGAFSDLKGYAFMHTFRDFDDIGQIMKDFKENDQMLESDRSRFMRENTWEKFVEKLERITAIK